MNSVHGDFHEATSTDRRINKLIAQSVTSAVVAAVLGVGPLAVGALGDVDVAGKPGDAGTEAVTTMLPPRTLPPPTRDSSRSQAEAARPANFPLQADSGNQRLAVGEWMRTSVKLSENGRLDGETKIWTNNEMRGFTGGAAVFFLDANNNVLDSTPLKSAGVDGRWIPGKPSSRTIWWNSNHPDVIPKVHHVLVRNKKNPTPRLHQIINEMKFIGKSVSEVIKLFG